MIAYLYNVYYNREDVYIVADSIDEAMDIFIKSKEEECDKNLLSVSYKRTVLVADKE